MPVRHHPGQQMSHPEFTLELDVITEAVAKAATTGHPRGYFASRFGLTAHRTPSGPVLWRCRQTLTSGASVAALIAASLTKNVRVWEYRPDRETAPRRNRLRRRVHVGTPGGGVGVWVRATDQVVDGYQPEAAVSAVGDENEAPDTPPGRRGRKDSSAPPSRVPLSWRDTPDPRPAMRLRRQRR